MTTAATSLLGLALPVTGELSGVWGQTVNDSITTLLDSAVAGTTTLSTDADVTLTTTTLAANQARQAILLCSGARTALRTITAPAQSKIYTIINATTGGFSVKLVGVGPTTGLTIPNGASAVVAWNGSDFIEVGSATVGNLTVNGNLSVTGTTSLTGVATLTANPVLSAGTANGVAYLNGSKVVTTGSALTFDGTNLSPASSAQSLGTSSVKWGTVYAGALADGSDQLLGSVSTTLRVGFGASWTAQAFAISGSEQMRLTSTGLGIGTSSPAAKLDVLGSSGDQIRVRTAGTEFYRFGRNSGTGFLDFYGSQTGYQGYTFGGVDGTWMTINSSGNLGIGTSSPVDKLEVYSTITARAASGTSALRLRNTTSDYQWQTVAGTNAINLYDNAVGSSRLTVDSSGNLGIGVTPSAWGSGRTVLEMPSSAYLMSQNVQINLLQNAYYDGSAWRYKNTNYAAYFQVANGAHSWYNAPSGTAGNAITFTQAMTLDASGRLLVGGTSASLSANQLEVQTTSGGIGFSTYSASESAERSSYSAYAGFQIAAYQSVSGSPYTKNVDLVSNADGTVPSTMRFWTKSSGSSSATERARIDSSGNLLVGTTSGYAGERQTVAYNGSTQRGIVVKDTASQNSNPMAFLYGSTLVGYIGITSSTTSYNTSSDYRLKNTIAPMTGALAKVAQLKPVTYKWNADGSDGEGFIAHELAEVVPQCVTGEKDAVDADGNPVYQGIDTSFLVATLTAAIQEQQALITQLTERITALESK